MVGAEVQAAGVGEGVGAGFAPPHAAAFQAVADHAFAGRFDHARADLPAILHVGWVVHAMHIVPHIAGQLAVDLDDVSTAARQIEGLQLLQQRWSAALLEGGGPRADLGFTGGFGTVDLGNSTRCSWT